MQTILVIEDDPGIRAAIVDILELEGYHAFSAEDGVRGVACAREHRPKLIICDIMMPYLDGYGVLSQLRKHAETATIPFIFLTGRTSTDDVRQGMNLGADDYLTKPFGAEELLRTIQARLDRHARLAEKLQRRVDELHNNLLSVLPHELNTPLQSILAGTEFLRDEYASLEPSDIEELLRIVHLSALRMRRLISNSLLHADLGWVATDSTRETVERGATPISVASTIQLVAQQEAAAATREADLHMETQEAEICILQPHLSKIVEEVLNNAFKYSKAGTPVEVVARLEEGELWLVVKNQGRGMRPEEIAAIGAFRQFHRKQYEQQGLGLGLTISQRLLELYQGKLLIESVQGEHTTVRVMLPLAAPTAVPSL
jgi:DNA-binding response OmpR family regulator/anti-sigma regulatory factor (Ser/Thr protein kinase)